MPFLKRFEANIGPVFFEQIEKRVFSHHDTPPAEVCGDCPIFSRVIEV
jgi:hypothetical protein